MAYTCHRILGLKRKEILIHAMKWMSLEDIMLSEISQSPKKEKKNPLTLYDSTYMSYLDSQIHRNRSTRVDARGWGEQTMRS